MSSPLPEETFDEFNLLLKLLKREQLATGQLFFRTADVGTPPDDSGRTIMLVIGVVAIPEGSPIKDGCRYSTASVDGGKSFRIGIDDEEALPGLRTMNADQFIVNSKWRV